MLAIAGKNSSIAVSWKRKSTPHRGRAFISYNELSLVEYQAWGTVDRVLVFGVILCLTL